MIRRNRLLQTVFCWLITALWMQPLAAARPVISELVPGGTATSGVEGIALPSPIPVNPPASSPFAAETELFPAVTKTIGSVIFLVGLILTVAFLLKRFMPQRFGAVAGRRQIEVLENVAFGDRQSLTLVRAGNTNLLLARTASGISLLEHVELLPAGGEIVAPEASSAEEPAVADTNQPALSGGRCETKVSLRRRFEAVCGRLRQGATRLWSLTRQLKTSWPHNSRQKKVGGAVSFNEILQSELATGSSRQSGASGELLSRLSQIRSQLQSQ
jgi:flagellar biogenesis protein FliO